MVDTRVCALCERGSEYAVVVKGECLAVCSVCLDEIQTQEIVDEVRRFRPAPEWWRRVSNKEKRDGDSNDSNEDLPHVPRTL